MVTGDLKLDILILEVFEEHEETFFWPLDSQKEAKSFIKFLHEKGFLYEDMCKEIGEFEHNFRAWRKGLGRVGIGTRLMDRINRYSINLYIYIYVYDLTLNNVYLFNLKNINKIPLDGLDFQLLFFINFILTINFIKLLI